MAGEPDKPRAVGIDYENVALVAKPPRCVTWCLFLPLAFIAQISMTPWPGPVTTLSQNAIDFRLASTPDTH
jgi:hypothetical protein